MRALHARIITVTIPVWGTKSEGGSVADMNDAASGISRPGEVQVRALAFGAALWAWLVAVVLPTLVWGFGSYWPLGLGFPLVVAVGMLHRSLRVRRVALLFLGPSTLALCVFFRDEMTRVDAWDSWVRAVMAVAAAAYLIAAAAYCEQRAKRRSEDERLPASALAPVDPARRIFRRLFLGVTAVVSLGLLAVAPRVGASGESAELMLATATGLMVALGLLGTLFGPALRANHGKVVLPPQTPWLLLSVGIASLAGWMFLRFAESR